MRNRSTLLFAMLAFLLLSACATTPEERARRAAQEEARQRAQAEASARAAQALIDQRQDRCEAYGFTRGTESFASCIQTELHREEELARQDRAVRAARTQEYLGRLQEIVNPKRQVTQCVNNQGFVTCTSR